VNREALNIAVEIALLLGTSVVGELHITRKQYLDGSIPTGFQRTAIVGIEGEIPLQHKKVRIIQLSIEEDSCREVSDVGHLRVYTTDRLGMPLIESVTYPDMLTPQEAAEAGDYLRHLVRSTGKVRTGIGAGRQDVNVSVTGGTRVEIKGVAHIRWIPQLTHNEAFRQVSLLQIKSLLEKRGLSADAWTISHQDIYIEKLSDPTEDPVEAAKKKRRLTVINLPGFAGVLSHFTQPGQVFANELSDRLKVIACLERPNLQHSEQEDDGLSAADRAVLRKEVDGNDGDAQLLIWGPSQDIDTALEVIEERCKMAFDGVPNETRKALPDGTTIFERVLPGPDRMYPDTDSAPISIKEELIEACRKNLPVPIGDYLSLLRRWNVPEDTHYYLIRHNLAARIGEIADSNGLSPAFVGTMFGHTVKGVLRRHGWSEGFSFDRVVELCHFAVAQRLERQVLRELVPLVCRKPQESFESLLVSLHPQVLSDDQLAGKVRELAEEFGRIGKSEDPGALERWTVGQLKRQALGSKPMPELQSLVKQEVSRG
ncbi:MAG: Glu-tRNA(Gln) amidotransferase subunit GatE, partial [candidate division Zixibacteria bacterium]|nr:Glu-tRNA(Gln) amidotransferase subunit GatE [candidate division Zixibacteria bacterium]